MRHAGRPAFARGVRAGALSDVRAVVGARQGDQDAPRSRPDEAPALRPHPCPGAGGEGAVGGLYEERPGVSETAHGCHELPPDALQTALQTDHSQQVGSSAST